MKKTVFKFFTVSLALLLAVSMMLPAVSALQFANGQEIGSGKATSVENKTLGTGYTYSKATYTDEDGDTQAVYALEFNPTSGNYMPIMYSKYTGTGAAVLPTAQDAESKFGANIVGGVNANFYSTATGSTYAGYWVHDGRLAQAESGLSSEIVTFTSDGQAQIVDSMLTFDVYFNGLLVTYNGSSSLAYINKKSVSSNVSNLFYYWDTECGNNTDSVIDGVEILCKKLDGGELGIERILNGEIIEIRTDSHYSPVGKDEFVLYVKNDSPLKAAIEGTYKVGDTVSIKVNENVEESKAVTSSAITAFAGQYKIIENGEYAPGDDTVSLDHYNQLAQRTSFGIKADGSIVLVCTAGRKTTDNAPGLTIPELGQIMLQLGCVTAYNFDGGGSTQMIYKENGEFQYGLKSNEGANGRNVANCLLIAERPSELDFSGLDALIEAVDGVITTDEAVSAVAAAKAVKASDTAMEGDVIIASMKLQQILDAKAELEEVLALCDGIIPYDYSPTGLAELHAAYQAVSSLSEDADSDTIVTAARALKTAIARTGDISVNVTDGKSYETLKHFESSNNYGDSGNELTDGEIAGISNAYGAPWVAFSTRNPSSGKITVEGISRSYYDIIVDLGEYTENIKEFNAFTEYFSESGIDYCIAVDYAVSNDKVSWVEAGRASAFPEVKAGVNADLQYPLTLDQGVNGRYLRVRLIAAGTTQFIFVSEIQAYAYENTVSDIGYVTAFDKEVENADAVIFTPDFSDEALTSDNGNVSWTQVLVAEKMDGLYKIVAVYSNPGANSIPVEIPENGFVYAVHAGDGDAYSSANRAFCADAKVGQYFDFVGIDIENRTMIPGAYLTFVDTLVDDATVIIEGEYILDIMPETTVDEIEKQFVFSDAVTVTGASKNIVGTGVQISYGGITYEAVVIGDVSGDGIIAQTDYLLLKRHVLGISKLEGAKLEAGKLGGDSMPTQISCLRLKKHVLSGTGLFN